MRKFFNKYRNNLILFITAILAISGMSLPFLEFAKSHGHADRYPQLLMTLPLLLIYIIPFALLTNYLRKRFDVPKTVFALTWFLALAIPVNIGSLGNEFLSLLLLKMNLSMQFLNEWGASLTAPFTEEIAKGIVVLLVVLLFRQTSLKTSLLLGIIAGMGFQIIEDSIYIQQTIFKNGGNGFVTAFERIAYAGLSHWVFSAIFAVGLIALCTKSKVISKKRAVFYLIAPVAIHFAWNSPLDFSGVNTVYGIISWMIVFSIFKIVDKLPKEDEMLASI
ncbi:PrsW family intramembrane metalloprotease [Streptococcus dentapri]|uniref:PrsW family intramembrane metalloprotease n=1 Tax=Streptococcus dentapri TaxID=573564 RepID=A0ABV8CZI5_9STRE